VSEAGVEHRTTTILAAGVVGYSRLMGEDEEGRFRHSTSSKGSLTA
jgi:class 3 adenylate cyclase